MENEKEKLEDNKKLEKKHSPLVASKNLIFKKGASGITLIALVITIVLNCSYLAMERMIEKEPNILKI